MIIFPTDTPCDSCGGRWVNACVVGESGVTSIQITCDLCQAKRPFTDADRERIAMECRVYAGLLQIDPAPEGKEAGAAK